MTQEQVMALRAGDKLYRVDSYMPLDGDDLKYRLVEFKFAADRVTDYQVRRGQQTIRLDEDGRIHRVSVTTLRLRFSRTPEEALEVAIERAAAAIVEQRAAARRAEAELKRLQDWVSEQRTTYRINVVK